MTKRRRTKDIQFLKPAVGYFIGNSWLVSSILLALLTIVRAYAVLGDSRARPLLAAQFLVMAALPFVLTTRTGQFAIGLRSVPKLGPWLVLTPAAGAACAIAVFAVGTLCFGNTPDNWFVTIRETYDLRQLRGTLSMAELFAAFTIPAILLSPVGEEIFFRGLLHESFRIRWSDRVAAAVSAAGFGFVQLLHHGAQGNPSFLSAASWVVLMAGAGYVFTICRRRTESIWAAVVAHAAFNMTMNATIFAFLL